MTKHNQESAVVDVEACQLMAAGRDAFRDGKSNADCPHIHPFAGGPREFWLAGYWTAYGRASHHDNASRRDPKVTEFRMQCLSLAVQSACHLDRRDAKIVEIARAFEAYVLGTTEVTSDTKVKTTVLGNEEEAYGPSA